MGCNNSREIVHLPSGRIDDSIHVMMQKDKKRPNGTHGFVARKPHPLLEASEDGDTVDDAQNSEDEMRTKQGDLDRLLYHAKNHCDTIDPRDLKLSGS